MRVSGRRIYGGVFAFGLCLFALASGAGLYRGFSAYGGPPPLISHHMIIDDLLRQNALGPALGHMRSAALLDLDNEYVYLTQTARVAERIEDREMELWALSRLVRFHPSNDRLRMRIEELEAGPP